MSACENCHARGKRDALHLSLAVGDFHARSHTLLAPIITEEVHVVYSRIAFVLIFKHDLRRFSGYLILHDWAGGGGGAHFPADSDWKSSHLNPLQGSEVLYHHSQLL